MDDASLTNRLDVYTKTKVEDEETGTTKNVYAKTKTLRCNIIPAGLSGSVKNTVANTQYSETTHRMRCRKLSLKPTSDMYFIDKDGLRYDIQYFQPDYKNNDFWEIMLKIKME